MKATAIAPANIAFIKYWGKKDEVLRLPENGSVSMCLSNLLTTTTVEFSLEYKENSVDIGGDKGNERPAYVPITSGLRRGKKEGTTRIIAHIDRIRKIAGISLKAKVVTKNNFPTGTGLSSSASGFAALTLAGAKAAGLNLTEKNLSILARQGSGSACRSIPDGFVEWLDGNTSETSYGISLFPPEHWEICDVVAVVSREKKETPTTEGMKGARSSLFLPTRLRNIKDKINRIKDLIKDKRFKDFGEMVEAEALELHAIMLTSQPSLIYLMPNSILLMKLVKKWRSEGLECYFTVNTGQDIHIIVEKKNVSELLERLKTIEEVRNIIINESARGARIAEEHLF